MLHLSMLLALANNNHGQKSFLNADARCVGKLSGAGNNFLNVNFKLFPDAVNTSGNYFATRVSRRL